MAKERPLTAKQLAAVEFYCNLTSETYNNWCASYKKANYSTCKGWKVNAIRLLHKDYIQTAIFKEKAKRQVKIEYNYETAIFELNEQITNLKPLALAKNIQAITAITALLREKNDITGLHKQNIHRTGDVQEPVLDEAEAKALRDIARQYKIKLAGTGT